MQNILLVRSLTKKFDDLTAVNEISFNVGTGSIFAFLGPNEERKMTIFLTTHYMKEAEAIAEQIAIKGA